MRCCWPTITSPTGLAAMVLSMDNDLGSQESDLSKRGLQTSASFLEPSYTSSKFLSATNITDHVVNTTAISVEDLGGISLDDVLFGEASFDDLLIYLRPDDEYVPLDAIDCLLEGASPAVGMKTESVLDGRPIPSFEVAIPNKKGLQLPAKYLKWAYDVLSKGWKALVPFDITGLTVFGLAKKAMKWKDTEEINFILTARRYAVERDWWNNEDFQKLLKFGYFSMEVSARRIWEENLPNSPLDDAIQEVLQRWPMSGSFRGMLAGRMSTWWRTCSRSYSLSIKNPHILEWLVLQKAGSLKVPLTEVPKAIRREQRRRRIREAAELQGEAVNDSIPEFLINRWGDKFQIATVDEAGHRVSPSCLVWAYDVKNYGWWNTVPKGIDPIGLSVFGLAKAVERIRKQVFTLSGNCYSCAEINISHRDGNGCERCESPWDLVEFWEWLRSRHFCEIKLDCGGVPTFRHLVDEIVNGVGFAPPHRQGRRYAVSPWECDPGVLSNSSQTMQRRMTAWWGAQTNHAQESPDTLGRWEFERVLLHRLAELDRESGTRYLSCKAAIMGD
ncbi:hypothetical protein GNI_000020 [Gregarina niphandrodes]|uniref:Uncharacterized protein n=1 Tax=Gregarina niphandrodes TaxID=110365 RepID=A0A023BDV5_GRENI|nr:hypothetical protein GNI_000020 [Gregarina niphandrodes]EZG89859.1 hypothetical protein GNI_000020 [Gregarina niphandrodes]|eukprot:XP_011128432.1 hypothetical protein GNI_000020 [Gregarina niphandrodes]